MPADRDRLTFLQRRALKELVRTARKQPGAALGPEDWAAYWRYAAQPRARAIRKVLRALPSSPRCGYCGAPFHGVGARIVRPLGYRPSRKNPNLCAVCVELAPPGGMTLEAGMLFADLRGFTALSEQISPAATTALLRRFYACAEKALFPEALIDKLIGDEVMALYVPALVFADEDVLEVTDDHRGRIAAIMLTHARDLLARVGYGSPEGPFADMGIGLDFGEVFIGNVGDAAVHDFTAVGDVVNTAARLQAHAAGGEAVVSARVARHLPTSLGPAEELTLKGKAHPVVAHRVQWWNRGT